MVDDNRYAPKRESGPEKSTGSMRYVKMYVGECLEGTIRFDFEPAERGVWYDLVILAGRMRVKGLIGAGSGNPYPRRWIAGILNIDEELLEITIEKCKNTQRISENSDGIRILNWSKYQSEYDRQAPYRKAKKAGDISVPEGPWDAKAWFACTIYGTPPKVKFLSGFAEQKWGESPNKPQEFVALRQIVEQYDIGPINEAMKILEQEDTITDFAGRLRYIIVDEVIGEKPKRKAMEE